MRLSIHDAYSFIMTDDETDLHIVWGPMINHLLSGWNFTDAPITVSIIQSNSSYWLVLQCLQNSPGEMGVFNHQVIKMIVVRSIWVLQGQLAGTIDPSQTSNIDPIIAFAVVMAHWALRNFQLGCNLDFGNQYYLLLYQWALWQMQDIQSTGDGQLIHLQSLTTCILCQGQKMSAHFSV